MEEPECKPCCYRIYNVDLKDSRRSYLGEEPVPNCYRSICLIDKKDLSRFNPKETYLNNQNTDNIRRGK